jgi:acetyltransferase
MNKNLQLLFSPKSVAIIGASASPEKVGAIILKNVIASGFFGKIYPVNPNAENINDLKCYPNVVSLPEVVDLALIAIPAAGVIQVLTEIGEKGIENVVVYSAGFKEIGEEGKALENSLIQTAQKYEVNLLGPNCLGFVSKLCPINATFGQTVHQDGDLRFISQSGALAASLFDYCNATGLGFSEFITLGNKSVVNENDVMNYFLEKDEKNKTGEQENPLGLYLESISNGKEFLEIAPKLSRRNPLFIIKPGKTSAAIKAMQSHTGSIAGADNVLNVALEQTGIVRCDTLEDYFDLSRAFAWEKAPLGPKLAIVSNAGGPAVISADAVLTEGLELVQFDQQTQDKLHQVLPRYASVLDPVDVLGDALADRIYQACEIILQTNQAQSLVVILTPQVMTQITKTAELIGDLSKKYKVPIFCSFIGGSLVAEGEQKLNEYKIPSFRFPERAISTIALMWKWKKWQKLNSASTTNNIDCQITAEDSQKIKNVIAKAVNNNQSTLDNLGANEILSLSGIPTPPTQTISNLDEAKKFVQENNYPVVLKLSAPGLLHKADLGGVIKDISNDEELGKSIIDLDQKITKLSAGFKGNIVKQIQKYIPSGTEVIIGIKNDPTFGPVLLFGAGGNLAELIVDRNLRLLPINLESAKDMVEKSKIYKILNGYRGEKPLALDKLYEVIVRLGQTYASLPITSEIEINPLIVTQSDTWAVDGKIVLKPQEPKPVAAGPRFKIAKALECKTLAGKFHNFIFETEAPISYKPGQYISVKVADTRINCYSIATNEGENKFSLLIDTSPGGPGSIYFEALKAGDKINFLGPFGTFVIRPDKDVKHILFLGTGSGCAPLRCMIDDLLKVQKVKTPITLYLGLRFQTDIFWKDYFTKLSADYPSFNFIIAISKPDATCQEKTGHITECIDLDFPDVSGMSAYLCGNMKMIEETTNMLISRGMAKEKIYTEKF